MSVAFAAPGDAVVRTSSLPSPTSDYSCFFRLKLTANPSGSQYQTYFAVGDMTGAYDDWVWIGSDVATGNILLSVAENGSEVSTTAAALTLNRWYWVGYTRSGSTHKLYLQGTQVGTSLTKALTGASTWTEILLGDDATTSGHGGIQVANFREWNNALTQSQLITEGGSYSAVRTTGLLTDTPLTNASTLTDASGNGHTWSVNGSLATGDGMPTGTSSPAGAIIAQDNAAGGSFLDYPHAAFSSPGTSIVASTVFGGAYVIENNEDDHNNAWGRRYAEFGWGSEILHPNGRAFHVSACFNHDAPDAFPEEGVYVGPVGQIDIGRNHPGDVDGPAGSGYLGSGYSAIFTLVHGNYDATTGFLVLSFNSHPGGVTEVGRVEGSGAFLRNTPIELTVEGEISTVTGGNEWGGGTAASDGWIKVLVNGVAVIDLSGLQYGLYISNQGPSQYYGTWANVTDPFHYVLAGPAGKMSNLCVRDDLSNCGFSCSSTPPPTIPPGDHTTDCCCSCGSGGPGGGPDGPPPTGVGVTEPPPEIIVLQPWTPGLCTMGGSISGADPLSPGELW